MNVYTIAKEYAESIMLERQYWSEDDIWDIASEHADGSEHVIYYSKAHDFVRAMPSDVESEAVDQCHDCGIMPDSYDDWAVKIAYFALQRLIADAVYELLENEEAA